MHHDPAGLTMAVWPLNASFAVLPAPVLVSNLAQGPVLTATTTARREHTPAELLGQVSTTGASLELGGFAAGGALGGVLVSRTDPTVVILLVVGLRLVAASLGAPTARPKKSLRVTP